MNAVPARIIPNTTCHLPRPDALHLFQDPRSDDLPWTGMTFGLSVLATWYWCTDQVSMAASPPPPFPQWLDVRRQKVSSTGSWTMGLSLEHPVGPEGSLFPGFTGPCGRWSRGFFSSDRTTGTPCSSDVSIGIVWTKGCPAESLFLPAPFGFLGTGTANPQSILRHYLGGGSWTGGVCQD